MATRCFSVGNPNPSSLPPLTQASSNEILAVPVRIESVNRRLCQRGLNLIVANGANPRGLGGVSLRVQSRRSWIAFAASHEESNPLETEIDNEKTHIKQPGKESEEAWEQVLSSFKEQALKLQSVSQEAYEVYSKKAAVVLGETAEKLKIQTEKSRHDLSIIAKEISEEGRQYITSAAENSPEPVKDVVETFASSADELKDVSRVRDFYVGIPYGAILSVGGFLHFMLTGSVSAIRFGMILGGILLALSVSSLRSWKKGESSDLVLKGQAAIAGVLFLRDARLLCHGLSIPSLIRVIISGAVTAFFVYRVTTDQQHQEGRNIDGETQT